MNILWLLHKKYTIDDIGNKAGYSLSAIIAAFGMSLLTLMPLPESKKEEQETEYVKRDGKEETDQAEDENERKQKHLHRRVINGKPCLVSFRPVWISGTEAVSVRDTVYQ